MSFDHLKNALRLLGTAALALPLSAAIATAADKPVSLALSGSDAGGESAISALGANLATVAAQYGKTPQELRRLLRRDSTLRVDRNGKLFYREKAPNLPAAPPQKAGVLDGALYPLAQTFSLHSKAGSKRLLILNFQGKTITGTYWNTSLARTSIVAPAFDIDRNPASFNDAERTTIQQIWQRVAEDYAPFDVDVTTDGNAAATAPAGSLSATVVITTNAAYGGGAPGIAYTSTFGNAAYDPAFVAYDTSLARNPKYIAEAVSHELGHRLGLDHDGTTRGAAYYTGQGAAPMTWAPIMGNSYTASITQFSKGEYANANNLQDDYLIMGRFLGYRDDDAGNSVAQAKPFPTTLSGSTRSGSFEGIIERQDDADLFSIQAAAGPLTAAVTTAALNPDLDAVVTLLDATGTQISTDNPAKATTASLSYTVTTPGTYYLKVSPSGAGTALSTGYSTYASRGNYRLTASFAATATVPPMAAITATPATQGLAPLNVNLSAAGSRPAGAITSYKWDLGNGATATTATVSASYATPGNYTVKLLVGSNGFSGGATKDIMVAKPFTTTISVVRIANGDGTYSGQATVYRTTDSTGAFVSPDPLVGTWSGGVRGTSQFSGMRKSGMTVVSPSTRDATACFTFTVNSLSGIDPAAWNFKETDSNRKPRFLYLPASPITATACPQQASR